MGVAGDAGCTDAVLAGTGPGFVDVKLLGLCAGSLLVRSSVEDAKSPKSSSKSSGAEADTCLGRVAVLGVVWADTGGAECAGVCASETPFLDPVIVIGSGTFSSAAHFFKSYFVLMKFSILEASGM